MPKLDTYVDFNNKRISFTLDVGKRRKYVLAVSEGKLTVRVPVGFTKDKVLSLIENNLNWIESNLARSAAQSGFPQSFGAGVHLRLLGNDYIISPVDSDKYKFPYLKDGKLVISVNKGFDDNYIKLQAEKFISDFAVKEITESMDRLVLLTGLTPKKVTVKSLSASWGRCGSNGNISINYKIITHPKRAVDYVCLHELCHLRYMDHSKEFWALVEKYCPDWREIRRSLKE